MNSKVGWMWAGVMLLVAALGLAWLLTRNSDEPKPAVDPGTRLGPPAPTQAPGQDPVALDAGPSASVGAHSIDGARESARTASTSPEATRDGNDASQSDAILAQDEEAARDPVKWETLEPILGGAAAIQARHAGLPYEDRLRRSQQLESAFATSDLEAQSPPESYAALKDELVWLRDNLGPPPAKPPQK